MADSDGHYPPLCERREIASRGRPVGSGTPDADLPPGATAMGKAVAAWLMVASALAATASSPRDGVQTAATRVVAVLQEDLATAHLDRPRGDIRRSEIRRIATDLFDF